MNKNQKSNEAQVRYWNSEMGEKWVEYQRLIDTCFQSMNLLLLDNAGIQPGARVLDIGCGSGATSLEIAQGFGQTLSVVGVDVSVPLLELARKRALNLGLENVSFLEADVQEKIPDPGKFDNVVSRFGVMFFTQPVTAFSRIHSALNPGGSVSFVAWSDVNANPWFQIPRDAAISILGKGAPSGPRDPGPAAFSDTAYVEDILSQAGFDRIDVQVQDNFISTSLEIDEMTEAACNLGPAVRLMKEKKGSVENGQAIREIVAQQFTQFQTKTGFDIPAKLVMAHAVRS